MIDRVINRSVVLLKNGLLILYTISGLDKFVPGIMWTRFMFSSGKLKGRM